MHSLFLGAGFSKWAANLPLASELFDFDINVYGVREMRRLEIVGELKTSWDKGHPLGLTEQFIEDVIRGGGLCKTYVLWYIGRRLSEPFIWAEFHAGRIRRHVLMIDENRRLQIPGLLKVRDFLQGFCGLSTAGIITTNYDMLVEYTLGTKGFNYGIPNQTLIGRGPYPLSAWSKPVKLTGRTRLAKIHGSISWDESGYYSDGRRGLTGDALIIPPTPEKDVYESLQFKFVWGLAAEILEKSTELLVFGFSFNPYDKEVLKLFEHNGRQIKCVLLVDIAPKLDTARALWPNASVIGCQPPPEGNDAIYEWKMSL